jgi:hypothetical protein
VRQSKAESFAGLLTFQARKQVISATPILRKANTTASAHTIGTDYAAGFGGQYITDLATEARRHRENLNLCVSVPLWLKKLEFI